MLRLEMYKGHTASTRYSPITQMLRKEFPMVDIREFWTNTDDAIFKAMNISNTPTYIFYVDDVPAEFIRGYSSYGDIRKMIQQHISQTSR